MVLLRGLGQSLFLPKSQPPCLEEGGVGSEGGWVSFSLPALHVVMAHIPKTRHLAR